MNEAVRNVFHQLKKAVMSAPVLAYPDPNKEYLPETDALKARVGGCAVPEAVRWEISLHGFWE